MLWSKTRDTAWMLIVIGTIAAYIEIVYSIMEMAGIAAGHGLLIGSVSLAAIVLPTLPVMFFVAAFLVVVIRRRY